MQWKRRRSWTAQIRRRRGAAGLAVLHGSLRVRCHGKGEEAGWRILSMPECRPQLEGYQRARGRFSLGASSKHRRVRRRRHAVPTAISSAGDYLRSLPIPALAMPPRKSLVQSGIDSHEEGLQAASVRFCRSKRLPLVRGAGSAIRPAQESTTSARRSIPAREAPSELQPDLSTSQRVSKTVFGRVGGTTSSMQTPCRFSRVSCYKNLSLPVVHTGLAHPSEEIL